MVDLSPASLRRWITAYRSGEGAFEERWLLTEAGVLPREIIDPADACPFDNGTREHGAWCLGWCQRQAERVQAAVMRSEVHA